MVRELLLLLGFFARLLLVVVHNVLLSSSFVERCAKFFIISPYLFYFFPITYSN